MTLSLPGTEITLTSPSLTIEVNDF
jgi:hypothetical protein